MTPVLRRLAAAGALAAALGGSALPSQAEVYAGSTTLAAAAVRVRGSDGVMYQVEVTVARHDLAGAKVDHELHVALKTCGEAGCFGPVYALPVEPTDVKIGGDTVVLTTTFAASKLVVSWKARKPQGDDTPGVPETSTVDGYAVTVYREDRSAPATVSLGAVACKTLSSRITNQTGAIVTPPGAASDSPPSKLPSGFYPTKTRKPRCF